MKKTMSAHVYNTIERYPQIFKTPKVEKAMGNLKSWMALRGNRGFDSCGERVFLKEMFEQNLVDDIVLVLIRGGGFNSLRAKLIRLYMNIDLLRLNNTHTQ